MNEIIAAAIGVLLGYGAAGLQEWRSEQRRKRALATALLIELRRADATLRTLSEDRSGFIPENAYPVLDSFRDDVYLFRPSTVQILLDFWNYFNLTRTATLRRHEGMTPATEASLRLIRLYAWFALGRVDPLLIALETEGGTLPPRDTPDASGLKTEPTPLPPDPFDPARLENRRRGRFAWLRRLRR